MRILKINIELCPYTDLKINKDECKKCIYHNGFKTFRGTPSVLCSWWLGDSGR